MKIIVFFTVVINFLIFSSISCNTTRPLEDRLHRDIKINIGGKAKENIKADDAAASSLIVRKTIIKLVK